MCADLARDCRIIGIDKRPPSASLRQAVPNAQWHVLDVSNPAGLHEVFRQNVRLKQPVDYILHFAAFYHYGPDWRTDYEITNIRGTANIIDVACCWGVKRVLFAASIGSLKPPPAGASLTESAQETVEFAYCKSKAMGETIMSSSTHRTGTIVLRIGGVFSDWCELPPLYSLIRLWSRRSPIGRCVPGLGNSGFPYIHRHELVQMVRRIVSLDDELDEFETFFGSENGCTSHNQLFPVIRKENGYGVHSSPIHVPPILANWQMSGKYVWNILRRKKTYERPWMLHYVDRPIRVDNTRTRERLHWTPHPDFSVLNRLPVIIRNFKTDRNLWEARNIRRNEARYEYHPD